MLLPAVGNYDIHNGGFQWLNVLVYTRFCGSQLFGSNIESTHMQNFTEAGEFLSSIFICIVDSHTAANSSEP
jgi:hypothetical protein